MLYTEIKYVNMLSPYVRNYKYLGNNLWRFSCPFCGDSAKNRGKARGYFLVKEGTMLYKCHNCGIGKRIFTFLKFISKELYNSYRLETFKEDTSRNGSTAIFFDEEEDIPEQKFNLDLISVYDLPEGHRAKEFLLNRKLPDELLKKFFYTQQFKKWMHELSEDYFREESERQTDYARIVIPYYNKDKEFFGFGCRALGDEKPKYINGKLIQNEEFIYGLDTVDKDKRVYAMEGAIDSLFIPNSIGVSGLSFGKGVMNTFDDLILCYDNEKRKKETTTKMEESIKNGFTVYIPPDFIKEKDINEMILNGYTSEKIKSIIDSNSFKGLSAELKFYNWRKK